MENRRLGVAYITRLVSIAYLTGFHAEPHERLMALAVRPDGATLIVPSLEEEKAQAHASDAEVVAWSDGEDPYELVQRALGRGAEVGVEKDHLTLHGAEVLTSRTGATELLDVGEEIRRLRLIKHEDEIAQLIRAAQITDDAYAHVVARWHAGLAEVEVALVRPGATTGDGDAAARRVIEQAGYGKQFFHRVGHGLGLEGHEDPSLDPGSRTLLEAGMVFTIEPGVYIPGFGGVRIEDDVVVEDGGCRVLTKADRSLRVITHT